MIPIPTGVRIWIATGHTAIVDNYATHKRPKVKAWLARHPR